MDRTTLKRIVDLIEPHVQTEGNRRALVAQAFFGTQLPGQIDYSGNAKTFATALVTSAEIHSEIEPGRLGTVALLEELKEFYGYDKRQEIEALIAMLLDEQTPPAPAQPRDTEAQTDRPPTISIGGDYVGGDKFSGDKVAGDKIAGDKVGGNQVKGGDNSVTIQQNVDSVGGSGQFIGSQTNYYGSAPPSDPNETPEAQSPANKRNRGGCKINVEILVALIGGAFAVIAALITVAPDLFEQLTADTGESTTATATVFLDDFVPTFTLTDTVPAVAPATDLPTQPPAQATAIPSETVTPTDTLQSRITITTAPAVATVAPSEVPVITTDPITIERSRIALHVRANTTVDIADLIFDLGSNTRYRMGDYFDNTSLNGGEGRCLYLFIQNTAGLMPDGCTTNAAFITQVTTDLQNTWRNASIAVTLAGEGLGNCAPQPNNTGVYPCNLTP